MAGYDGNMSFRRAAGTTTLILPSVMSGPLLIADSDITAQVWTVPTRPFTEGAPAGIGSKDRVIHR